MTCPNHGIELTNRKGVSNKTGKPYDFWACTHKENGIFCDYTYNPVKGGATSSLVRSPERQNLEAKVLASLSAKLDTLTDIVKEIASKMPQ